MDKKDLQIIEILAQNCRIPHTTIAQALKISKDSVSYRIKNLEKSNDIQKYILFIDSRKLGFTRYHLLLKFDASTIDRKKVLEKVSEHTFVMWINSFIGRYDVQIIVDATDGFHLNKIREEIFKVCNNKIKEYSILTHLFDLKFTQLNPILDLKTNFKKKANHSFSSTLAKRDFPVRKEFERYAPTKSEIEILNVLAKNPQESLVQIGRELQIDRDTVKKKISNLIEHNIILSFGGIPNLSKQGFVTYYLLVRLEQETPLEVLKKPFTKLQNIFYAGKMIGDYDMVIYLNARNPQELNTSIELFKAEIGKYIIHYDLLVQDEVHHWKQFTTGIYEYLLNEKKISK
jgi:DNA-binding Lrp family transcriptional regulator